MTSTKVFLSLAALLSALAGIAAVLRPPPPTPPVGTPRAERDGLEVEARRSHGFVLMNGSDVLVDVAVKLPKDTGREVRRDVSLALVLGLSGAREGAKMSDARRAAHRLVHLLGPDDELGLVHFGAGVEVVPRRKMDAAGQAAMDAAIDAIPASGTTNLSEALARGLELLSGAPGARQLVLMSDGSHTAGDVTREGLNRLAEAMRARGVTFTALGLGADSDGPLMQSLAELGGGMYGSLASAAQLEDALERELAAARSSRVRNVELTVTGFDGVSIVDSPDRRLKRRGPQAVLHLADLKPGATTHAWLRLYSSLLDESDQPRVTAAVRWFDLERDAPREVEVDVPFAVTDDVAVFDGSRDEAVFADAVRTFGMVPLAVATFNRDGCFEESPLSQLVNAAHALFRMAANALASGFETLDRPDRDRAGATPGERKHQARRLEK